MIKYMYGNPIGEKFLWLKILLNRITFLEMWSNAGKALQQIGKIITAMDRWTAKLALGNFKLNCKDDEALEERSVKKEKVIIDYWEQFVDRCVVESAKIQSLHWISPEDVMSVSSTATIAIPGVAIGKIQAYFYVFYLFIVFSINFG